MSLRTDYTGSLDTKLAEARQAGRDFVLVTNLAAITSGMASAAAQGKKAFNLNFGVSYQPQDLRLEGPLWKAYSSGILEGLASEDVMNNEVTVKLNTSDSLNTSIDLDFDFCG
jgi:hypothetical protein